MTRADVALLVFRTLALWLASSGLFFVVGTLAQAGTDKALLGAAGVMAGVGMLAIAAGGWAASPWLARTTFGGADVPVALSVTTQGVPPLACFVVGLVVFAAAIPQAMSWVAMQAMRARTDASLMNPDLLPALDQQSAGTGAEIVGRLVVGVVLIVLSRRPGIWAPD